MLKNDTSLQVLLMPALVFTMTYIIICLQHQRCEDEEPLEVQEEDDKLDAFPEGLLRVVFA